jgi:hypothetical protein
VTAVEDYGKVAALRLVSKTTYTRYKHAFTFASNDIINCQVSDLENPFNRYTLLMSDTGVLVKWLQNNGLLVTDLNCVTC